MAEDGGVVTLVFYRIGNKWWKEPALNVISAAAQMSKWTHVELAIGATSGKNGEMTNVCRVFNDDVGVELAARTGRNPQYHYLQLGCSKTQERAMLTFARAQVGKPFSNVAMARSLIWPRRTDMQSFFCAELVAACLRAGGLIDEISNPGAATPEGLYQLYRTRAATTANPYLLRQAGTASKLTTTSVVAERHYKPPRLSAPAPTQAQPVRTHSAIQQMYCASMSANTQRSGHNSVLRVLNEGTSRQIQSTPPLGLTLNSLNFRR